MTIGSKAQHRTRGGRPSKNYDRALVEARRPRANLTKALGLLQRAYDVGDARAAYALGTWFLHGRPGLLEKDMPRAVRLLTEAAAANVSDALFDLAVCYERGAGVRQSYKKAAVLYLRSALLGDKQAARAVGKLYWHGQGVKRDRAVARVWLESEEESNERRRASR